MPADLLALLAVAHPNASQGDLLAMLAEIPDKPEKGTKKPTGARSGSRPRTDASMERRRSWAFSGRLPQRIAARFTLAETAVLAVIAVQVIRHGACGLTVPHIAALAGVSETTVRNAVREAKGMGLVTVEERRKTAWISYPNTIRIVSPEWATWLRLTGAKARTPRLQDSNKKAESRSIPIHSRAAGAAGAGHDGGKTSKGIQHMNENEIRRRLILEIGRRLRAGDKGVKMQEALETIGVKIDDPLKREEIWTGIWDDIEHSGLFSRVHHSSQYPTYMDRADLTDEGRDPENWEDWAG